MRKLRDLQHEIATYIVYNPRCGIFASMGTGKTIAVLTAIDILKLLGELTGKVLVVAPLRVAQTTWPDELREWPHVSHMTMSVICGNAEQRRQALRKDADIYTINYENLPWLEETLGEKWPFRMVVADESTKLKGFRVRQGTKRARALAKHAHTKVQRFVQLTGTPAPNGIKDLWACGWFIDGGRRLGRTYSAFKQRWFRPDWNGYDIQPLPFAQKDIEKRLSDVCLTIDAKDYFDVDEPIENYIMVDLPPKARKSYNDMEREMYANLYKEMEDEDGDIRAGNIEAVNAAAKTMKCLQLANGAAYTDTETKAWAEVHDVKIKALEDIIEESMGAPILVAYNFRSDLERLKKAFPKARVLDKKPETIKEWNEGKISVLFAHPASAGHGLSLQHGGNILVFFSLNWNLEEYQQIIERIGPVRQKQSGYDRPVFIHYIMAKNTIDGVVRERLQGKQTVQEALLNAMKIKELDK